MLKETGDDIEGCVMSYYTFSENWTMWEMHPCGSEIVMCTKGQVLLIQEGSKGVLKTLLHKGEYTINNPGVWHTANCVDRKPAAVLFITAGKGTQHRPRKE